MGKHYSNVIQLVFSFIQEWCDYVEVSPIGKILGERRRAQGLRMEEIAEKAGITLTKVFHIETGGLRYPSKKDLIAIGDVLGISEDEVMRLAGYDNGVPLLYKNFPELQIEQEAPIVTSDPHINEMLRDTDPEELKKMVSMLVDFAKNKKGSNKLGF